MDKIKKFTNELGNTIELKVSEKNIEGAPGIVIFIAGPTSDIEIHITRKEAEVLSKELANVLTGKAD